MKQEVASNWSACVGRFVPRGVSVFPKFFLLLNVLPLHPGLLNASNLESCWLEAMLICVASHHTSVALPLLPLLLPPGLEEFTDRQAAL